MLTHPNAHVRRVLAHRSSDRATLSILTLDPIAAVSKTATAALTAAMNRH